MPYLEKTFRLIDQPYGRIVEGASTGGWEALALQLHYPDLFGGAWIFNPDPIDFTRYRSAEHTSELQSLMRISYAVFCLKKNKNDIYIYRLPYYKTKYKRI